MQQNDLPKRCSFLAKLYCDKPGSPWNQRRAKDWGDSEFKSASLVNSGNCNMNSAAPVTPAAGISVSGSDTTTEFRIDGAGVGTDVTGAKVGRGFTTAIVGLEVGFSVVGFLVISNE